MEPSAPPEGKSKQKTREINDLRVFCFDTNSKKFK
jgi:hypothetical protein